MSAFELGKKFVFPEVVEIEGRVYTLDHFERKELRYRNQKNQKTFCCKTSGFEQFNTKFSDFLIEFNEKLSDRSKFVYWDSSPFYKDEENEGQKDLKNLREYLNGHKGCILDEELLLFHAALTPAFLEFLIERGVLERITFKKALEMSCFFEEDDWADFKPEDIVLYVSEDKNECW